MRRRLLWMLLILALSGRAGCAPGRGTAAGFSDDFRLAVYYGVMLVFVGAPCWSLFRERFSQALEAALIWVVVGLLLALGYTYRFELRDVADRVLAELVPGYVDGARRDGRDRARPRRRLLGGGAGQRRPRRDGARHRRELRRADPGGGEGRRPAARSAVLYGQRRHRQRTRPRGAASRSTASRSAVVIERAVPALIAQPRSVRASLLGMSFLNRLQSWEVRGDRLILRGYP